MFFHFIFSAQKDPEKEMTNLAMVRNAVKAVFNQVFKEFQIHIKSSIDLIVFRNGNVNMNISILP